MKNRVLIAGLTLVVIFSSWMGAAPGENVSAKAPTPTPTATASAGQSAINPLTGLPVEDASLLALPPALISISNFPVSARPQTGLSTSPLVFEMYIGEGMTRFLALFYGEYANDQPAAAVESSPATDIGPIRSGRLPYDDVRKLYDGFLVTSGADAAIAQQLGSSTTVYNKDPNDINGTGISLANLQIMAEAYQATRPEAPDLQGMQFQSKAPGGGENARRLWMFYNYYNQVEWTYDAASGRYLRAQDQADASGLFYPATDKLTGEQLGFENVVVLLAPHEFKAPTLVDIKLMKLQNATALLFRDGKVYRAKWSSRSPFQPIQLVNEAGKPIPFKPGHTWFQVVNTDADVWQLEPGVWKARFYNPK